MFTSLSKKVLVAGVFAATLFVGGLVAAGEPATIVTVTRNPSTGSDGKSYHSYGDDAMSMLDAINRDHPVSTPYTNGY